VDAGGFVLSVVDRRVPLGPNSIVVPAPLDARRLAEPGDPALLSEGRVEAGGLVVLWDGQRPPLWDPRVTAPRVLEPGRVARWALLLLRTLSPRRPLTPEVVAERLFGPGDLDARTGVLELIGSVRRRDPGSARGAARLLTGRGSGLTPAGDDLIAGAAVTVAALGPALGFSSERQGAWTKAVVLPDLAHRTTALSATLLRLAAAGHAPEPLHRVLQGPQEPERALRSLPRLLAIGRNTGWATAAAAGFCMSGLAATAAASPIRKECP
jgi:uncharacterized protein DUF2877